MPATSATLSVTVPEVVPLNKAVPVAEAAFPIVIDESNAMA